MPKDARTSSLEQLRWQEAAVMASSGVPLTAHSLFNNVEILGAVHFIIRRFVTF